METHHFRLTIEGDFTPDTQDPRQDPRLEEILKAVMEAQRFDYRIELDVTPTYVHNLKEK